MVIRDEAHSRGLVLVVGSNEGMQVAIDKLLDAAGFSGISYSSAEDLMAGGQVEEALCVISDIKLPATSGFELLAQLRASYAGTPVILISAKDTAAIRNKAKTSGAAAHLAKPFAGAELIAAIEHVSESARSSGTRSSFFSRSTTR